MYARQYGLCHSDRSSVLSNRHFRPYHAIPGKRFSDLKALDDYRIDLEPADWGPSAWGFLFAVAQSYGLHPTDDGRRRMFRFLDTIRFALPCANCRKNFSHELLRLTSEDLKNSETLAAWLVRLREQIQIRKGRSRGPSPSSPDPSSPDPSSPDPSSPEPGTEPAENNADALDCCRACKGSS